MSQKVKVVSYLMPFYLPPLLFVFYTNECQCHYEDRCIIKFTDDSTIVSLLSNDIADHGPAVDDFSECGTISSMSRGGGANFECFV